METLAVGGYKIESEFPSDNMIKEFLKFSLYTLPPEEYDSIDSVYAYACSLARERIPNSITRISHFAWDTSQYPDCKKLIGISVFKYLPGENPLYCSAIAVNPNYRRNGIGTRLLTLRHEEMVQKGILKYKPELNRASKNLFEKIGLVLGNDGFINLTPTEYSPTKFDM